VAIGPLTFSLDAPGVFALVGDATMDALLATLAGAERPHRGTAVVGGAPATPRKDIAYAPYVPLLPDALRVDEYLGLAAKVRGEPPVAARARLDVLGVGALAERRIDRLAFDESRAVALAEALTSRAPFLFLAEPLAELDARAVGRVPEVLEARVKDGAMIVLSTSSPADAAALATEQLFFERGTLVQRRSVTDPWEPPLGPDGARLFLRTEGARFLLAELAADQTFSLVRAEGAELVVTGRDAVAMASAVASAVRRANVELTVMSFEPPEGAS
jgi:ABC-type multidrug transport system ATPase subunit